MPLTAEIAFPAVDIAATRRAINEHMAAKITEAARVWVLATTDIVPVLTGAAKASFLKLAAAAGTTLAINPVAPSRIELGVSESIGIIETGGEVYRFLWSSELAHISIVEGRVGFLSRGQAALNTIDLGLPAPVFKVERG